MKWFNDLKISSKLLVGFMLVAAVAAVSGWLSLSAMGEMKTRSHAMYADRLMSITDLSYANFAFLISRADLRGYMMTKDPERRRELAADIETQAKATADRLDAFRKKTLSREETDLLEKHVAARESFYRARAQVLQLAGSGQDAKAAEALEAAQPLQDEARKELRALIDLESHGAEDEEKANEADAESARTRVLIFIAIGVLLAIGLGLLQGRMIGNPLKNMLVAAEKLAVGDVNVSIDLHTKDEVGALAHAFRVMAETTKDRAGLAQKIAAGDVTTEVKAKSEQDVLGKSFQQVVETLRKLIAEMEKLTKAAAAGQLATRGNAEQFQGGYKQIVTGVNQTLDAVIGPLNVSAEYVDRISKGDIPPKITDKYNGDFNEIKNNLNNCIDNINALVADTGMLIKAAVEGKLAARADASKHQGDFRKIVEGVNQTLDAVIGPLNVSAEYVDRISKGDIPPKITDKYNGDFNEIKNNLNNCIDNVNALVADTGLLMKAAVDGKLATRADASKHQGDFRKIVEGVNQTLDAVIGPLNVSAEYVDRISKGDIPPKITDKYNGDFNEIKNNLNNCIDNIRALVTETGMLITASAEGRLATRADAAKHQGDYRKIVEGVNEMLDAILLPIGEGNRVLAQISAGKIDELIAQTYKGDHEKMKQAVNNVAMVMQAMQKELARLTQASSDGRLSERGKTDQFQGAYAGIVKGVNEILDAILLPIGEGNRVLGLIRGGNLRERVEIACKGDHEKMKNAVNGVHGWLTDLVAYVTKIANGDMTANVDKASNDDQIHEWLLLLKSNINGLVDDVNTLAQASANGRLGVRADAAKHQGDYRKIVEGFNKTLDIVVEPLKMSANQASSLASSAEELTAVSNQMASNAEETATQANVVSAASEQVSKNVTVVATGSEQMQSFHPRDLQERQ